MNDIQEKGGGEEDGKYDKGKMTLVWWIVNLNEKC